MNLRLTLPLAILFAAFVTTANAQDPNATTGRSSLSMELDPAPFILNGYSFSVRYAPRALANWSVMGSVFSSQFPDGMITDENRKAGWHDLRFEPSHALFVDYDFGGDGKGLYVGPAVFLYRNVAELGEANTTHRFTTVYPNLRVGYTWFPFRKAGLYLSPWVNLGRELMLDAPGGNEGPEFELAAAKYIVALHVGYRCWF